MINMPHTARGEGILAQVGALIWQSEGSPRDTAGKCA